MRKAASGHSLRGGLPLAALVVFVVGALLPAVARASHYAVADVPRLVSSTDAEKLHKAGVETTEQLLDKAARSKDRKTLAKASGLSASQIWGLAQRCDLLRIKGVGSEMVLLLEASGIKNTAELAKREAAALTDAVTSANKTHKISEKPPTEPQLADWIAQAKKLPQLLEK